MLKNSENQDKKKSENKRYFPLEYKDFAKRVYMYLI